MAYADVKQRLDAGQVIILDGGTGTELERRGVAMDTNAWCGPATLENTAVLQEIHSDYIRAGADVITANTYATSRMMLKHAGIDAHYEAINKGAIDAALAAREACGRPDVAVAGSLSHMVPRTLDALNADAGPEPDYDTMVQSFAELAATMRDRGCDLILVEMMYHPQRMIAAFDGAATAGLPVWAGFAARRGDDGRVLAFARHEDIPFSQTVSVIKDRNIEAAGVMHSPSDLISDAMAILRASYDGPLISYPDSGFFRMPHWQFENIIAPEDLTEFARGWVNEGIQGLGGCCGLAPEHIAALAALRD